MVAIAQTEQQTGNDWYESGLPLRERKKRGHFSTPPLLVQLIIDACGYTPDADLAAIRVFDPACGSGNFLIEAARRLLASARGLPAGEQAALLRRNIWGLDPDPISCFLTEMRLESLLPGACPHIHQADSLALHREPCVDLFLANPPYLAAKNNDLSGYRSALQRGQTDSYLLFLQLALQVVRPGGWMGLVLPDPVLARLNAAGERERLLRQVTLHHLWHLSGVFSAEVGAVVLVAQNTPPQRLHQVAWVRSRWQNAAFNGAHTVEQVLFLRQPAAELRYLLSSESGALLERLRACLEEPTNGERRFAPLGEFVSISRGEELGRESSLLFPPSSLAESESSERPLPVLRGGIDMRPFSMPHGAWCIARDAIRKPLARYLTPKLLIVKSTDRLQATLDTRGHAALQTLYMLHVRSTCGEAEQLDDLYFFLALLNSRLLRDYVYMLHTAYKWVQPQIEQRVLASLPVPIVRGYARASVIEQAKTLARACSAHAAVVEWNAEITSRYEALEETIRALYASALEGELADKGVMLL